MRMDFKFIDENWAKEFQDISLRNSNEFKFVTPFIQLKTIKDILKRGVLKFKLITRFNLSDFYKGVSSLDAIEYILEQGGQIKGIKNLHSKLYVFDSKEAILSSANLTQSALLRNFEFGMYTSQADAISFLEKYFDDLWNTIPSILDRKQICKWRKEIDSCIQSGKDSYRNNKLKDYGFNIKKNILNKDKINVPKSLNSGTKQFFIKFFGEGNNRVDANTLVSEEIKRSGCHWACTYPTKKIPRSVCDGDVIFMSRLVSDPKDIMIFGYATGNKYKAKRDDASPYDIQLREFKKKWPRYIRVHDAQFINGLLKDGVSMYKLMNKFEYNSFASTLRNKISGKGNIDPRKAYSQQASVELTEAAAIWLKEEVESRIDYFGRISNSVLSKLE